MEVDRQNSLERSHQLSLQHVDDAVSPFELAAVLNSTGVKYVLIGGHALGYLTGFPRDRGRRCHRESVTSSGCRQGDYR